MSDLAIVSILIATDREVVVADVERGSMSRADGVGDRLHR
jgi:hypothetical protein